MIDIAELKRLAENATYRELIITPRSLDERDLIDAGESALSVAAKSRQPLEGLGWEIQGPAIPGRGDVTGPDAAYLQATSPAAILELIERLERAEACQGGNHADFNFE